MAFTQSDIDTLKDAIKSNVKSVKFADGREVDYRDIAEMQTLLGMMQADVAAAGQKGGVSYATFERD